MEASVLDRKASKGHMHYQKKKKTKPHLKLLTPAKNKHFQLPEKRRLYERLHESEALGFTKTSMLTAKVS